MRNVKAEGQKLIPNDAIVVSIVTGNGLKDISQAGKSVGIENALIRIEADMSLLTGEFVKRGIK